MDCTIHSNHQNLSCNADTPKVLEWAHAIEEENYSLFKKQLLRDSNKWDGGIGSFVLPQRYINSVTSLYEKYGNQLKSNSNKNNHKTKNSCIETDEKSN